MYFTSEQQQQKEIQHALGNYPTFVLSNTHHCNNLCGVPHVWGQPCAEGTLPLGSARAREITHPHVVGLLFPECADDLRQS